MKQIRKRKGFSLAEVLVGVFITVSGTMSVLTMVSVSTKVSKQTEVRAVALQAAREQLERLKSLANANRPTVAGAEFTIPDRLKNQFPSGEGGIEMSGEYTIRQDATNPNVQQLVVAVRWRALATEQKFSDAPWSEVSLSTLVAVQPLNISWTGIYDPPPPAPTTTGGTTGGTGWEATTGGGSTGTTGGSTSTGGSTGGEAEEVGGCTFTYGPC